LGIANHSEKWQGVQLHLIREGADWWERLLSRHYQSLIGVYQSERYFIFEAQTNENI